jgi:uncharacterized membrane protein
MKEILGWILLILVIGLALWNILRLIFRKKKGCCD